MKIKTYLAIAAVGAVFAQASFAQDDATSVKALLEKVEALEQKVKILERNRELDQEVAEAKSKETPKVALGANGFAITSADSNFVFKIKGYVQADSRLYFDDKTPVNDTFLLRRVRPIFEGTVFKDYDYRVMLDLASGLTTSSNNIGLLQDAYVNAHYWQGFQIQIGKMKEPVGLERLQSGANLLFVERGYPTQLLPNRDVGIQFHGNFLDNRLTYAVGLFNGVSDGNSGDIETDDDEKDVAARIFTEPFKNLDVNALRGLGFGVAGTIGNQAGPLRSFTTPGVQKFFSYATGDGTNAATANIAADGDHWRITPQFYYYWGPLGLLGEYVFSSQELRRDAGGPSTFVRTENEAWQVEASWILTGEDNSFKPLIPSKPFSLSDGGWGAWEVKARVGELSIDETAFPLVAKSGSAQQSLSWGIGLNWYLNRHVKANLDYEHTHFSGIAKKPSAVTARDENAFLARVQFGF